MPRTGGSAIPQRSHPEARRALELADWRRRVADLYAAIRQEPDPLVAWRRWRQTRDELFATHAQSPLLPEDRQTFRGLDYFDYDPAYRCAAELQGASEARFEIATPEHTVAFRRVAIARLTLQGADVELPVYWLETYGGGIFLPFKDRTSGDTTYGGGRYLLDGAKGADLGTRDGTLVLDFNFSYNPSCAYDPRWVCPLAPPQSAVDVELQAGEKRPLSS